MKLLVVSHTKTYKVKDRFYGWSPTTRELNFLSSEYSIVHCAPVFVSKAIPVGFIEYSESIRIIPLPPITLDERRHQSFRGVLINFIRISLTVRYHLRHVELWHLRAPTALVFAAIPWLFISRKRGWIKYAGDWNAVIAPISYRIQKKLLLNFANAVLTTNNSNIGRTRNIATLQFANPCLYLEDRIQGIKAIEEKKNYNRSACFVGRIEKEKGILLIGESLDTLAQLGYSELIIVGQGILISEVRRWSHPSLKITITESLDRSDLFLVYKRCELLLLPSLSEGFPKVVAEAANFGCIPVVSDISDIRSFFNVGGAFLWDSGLIKFSEFLGNLKWSEGMALDSHESVKDFVYDKHLARVTNEIFTR